MLTISKSSGSVLKTAGRVTESEKSTIAWQSRDYITQMWLKPDCLEFNCFPLNLLNELFKFFSSGSTDEVEIFVSS